MHTVLLLLLNGVKFKWCVNMHLKKNTFINNVELLCNDLGVFFTYNPIIITNLKFTSSLVVLLLGYMLSPGSC